jgi:hypothetical protein
MAVIPTVGEVSDLARATLADVAGDVYSNTVLAPFMKRAAQKAARFFRASGSSIFRKQSGDISVAAASTSLVRGAGPTGIYPADMLRPIEIRERVTTEPVTEYKVMRCQNGFLPADVATGDYRQYWDWIGDTIVFPAGAKNSYFQIQYEANFTDPNDYTTPANTINIPEAGEALALLTAAYAFAARDERENFAKHYEMAMDDLSQIAAAEAAVPTARAARYGSQ